MPAQESETGAGSLVNEGAGEGGEGVGRASDQLSEPPLAQSKPPPLSAAGSLSRVETLPMLTEEPDLALLARELAGADTLSQE